MLLGEVADRGGRKTSSSLVEITIFDGDLTYSICIAVVSIILVINEHQGTSKSVSINRSYLHAFVLTKAAIPKLFQPRIPYSKYQALCGPPPIDRNTNFETLWTPTAVRRPQVGNHWARETNLVRISERLYTITHDRQNQWLQAVRVQYVICAGCNPVYCV